MEIESRMLVGNGRYIHDFNEHCFGRSHQTICIPSRSSTLDNIHVEKGHMLFIFVLEYLFLVGQNVLSKVLSFGFRPGRHKTGWTAAENDKTLEISDLRK